MNFYFRFESLNHLDALQFPRDTEAATVPQWAKILAENAEQLNFVNIALPLTTVNIMFSDHFLRSTLANNSNLKPWKVFLFPKLWMSTTGHLIKISHPMLTNRSGSAGRRTLTGNRKQQLFGFEPARLTVQQSNQQFEQSRTGNLTAGNLQSSQQWLSD